MNVRTNGTTAPLDCTTPLDALLELTAWIGGEGAIIDDYALKTTPEWGSPQFNWPPLFNQVAHGSIAHLMPEKVYAFTSVGQAEDVPEFGALSTLDGAFIIGPRMKAVVDAFDILKSELLPINMVLRDCDVRDRPHGEDFYRLGGGAVVEGRHWLWHVYNRYDLVDRDNSEEEPYWVEKPRYDLPGSPIQRFSLWGNKAKLALHRLPYEESPVFKILGNETVFISPAFAAAMNKAGVLWPDGGERYVSASIRAYYLDRPRQVACSIDCREKKISEIPKIRIAGTDILVTSINEPPFRSSPSKREQR